MILGPVVEEGVADGGLLTGSAGTVVVVGFGLVVDVVVIFGRDTPAPTDKAIGGSNKPKFDIAQSPHSG